MFTSTREKHAWALVGLVIVTIFLVLFIGKPMQERLLSQEMQVVMFLTGLLLTAITVFLYAFKYRPSGIDLALWTGLGAVYIMFAFRLGAPERSHLIEYTVLAILVHRALEARYKQGSKWYKKGLLAIGLTSLVGVVDESMQLYIPDRTYDPEDIVFNISAAILAIAATTILKGFKNIIQEHF